MKLEDAIKITHDVDGRDYWYMSQWGLSIIKEAIYTIYHRVNVKKVDLERAECIQNKINRKY